MIKNECKYYKEDEKKQECKILNELVCRKNKCSFYRSRKVAEKTNNTLGREK
ncbi:MAG: hypothetical protein V8R81_01760 [Clostridia bacterium]